MQIKKK